MKTRSPTQHKSAKVKLRERFTAISDAWALAQGIVDTVREPVLVLDKELRVITASRSFYSGFKVSPKDTQGRHLYALGDRQWNIPKLRVLLEKIIPEKGVMEGYEVEHEFPSLGRRTMCLNARQVFCEGGTNATILLGMEDITERRSLAREKDELLKQKGVLLEELQHRVANSLQIIASILLMKARTAQSEETRLHLQDAHKRVMSIAAVQKQLHASGGNGSIDIGPYLARLLRDNLDENGASIWMRRGGRAERQLTMAAVLARLLIDAERQSASAFSVFLIVAWAAGRPRPRFRSRASRRR